VPAFGATEAEQALAVQIVHWRACGLPVPQIQALLKANRQLNPRTGRPLDAETIRSVLARHRLNLSGRGQSGVGRGQVPV